MSSNIISSLPELRKDSGIRINPTIEPGLRHGKTSHFIRPVQIANAVWAVELRNGADSLLDPTKRQAIKKTRTLSAGHEQFIDRLNHELLGGDSYPVLTAILGTAAGVASLGGGLIFTVATTAISIANSPRKVLARVDDEIWHVEEVGRNKNKVEYVSSFFLAVRT